MSVLFETSLGDIVIDLEVDACPKTCENFWSCVKCITTTWMLSSMVSFGWVSRVWGYVKSTKMQTRHFTRSSCRPPAPELLYTFGKSNRPSWLKCMMHDDHDSFVLNVNSEVFQRRLTSPFLKCLPGVFTTSRIRLMDFDAFYEA